MQVSLPLCELLDAVWALLLLARLGFLTRAGCVDCHCHGWFAHLIVYITRSYLSLPSQRLVITKLPPPDPPDRT